ncbi:MAG: T9SS type A sorting domain-containing protein [Candidatus Neomarinimicrobiota bacterium]
MLSFFTFIKAQICPEFGTDITIHHDVPRIVSLPPHQTIGAQMVSLNSMKISWDEYWTSFLNQCYEDHYEYPPNPIRFSMYRSAGILWQEAYTAIGGAPVWATEYIDTPPYPGIWTYAVMAISQPPNGYDHWSPRTSITIDTINNITLNTGEDFCGSCYSNGKYAIGPNYPNPFNMTTKIHYEVSDRSHIRIMIYNMLGREIRLLENSLVDAGTHVIQWNGLDGLGQPVSAGIYLYQIQSGEFVQTKKMVLLK